MIYCSLNKNTYYESSANNLDYKIVDDNGNVIYFGHSVKNPRTGINKINITEIIRDYLSSNLEDNWPELSNSSGYTCNQDEAFIIFSLIAEELILEKYAFLKTNIATFDGSDLVLSYPINGKLDPRMKVFWTKFNEVEQIDYSAYNLTHRILTDGGVVVREYWASAGALYLRIDRTDGTTITRTFLGHQNEKYEYDVSAGDLVQFVNAYPDDFKIYLYGDYVAFGKAVGTNIKYKLFTSPVHLKDISNIYISDTDYTLQESGFESLFEGNSYITIAPDLMIYSLKNNCYKKMFKDCINLKNVPQLPAYTLKEGCYVSMFEGCTSITSAHLGNATNNNSSSLGRMFYGCSSLSFIKCMHSSVPAAGYSDWVYGVSEVGTFVKKRGVSWPTGPNGIPEGWTVQEADS